MGPLALLKLATGSKAITKKKQCSPLLARSLCIVVRELHFRALQNGTGDDLPGTVLPLLYFEIYIRCR